MNSARHLEERTLTVRANPSLPADFKKGHVATCRLPQTKSADLFQHHDKLWKA